MSDTTPKDQPPKPLQFPEPVQVQARTRTHRKKPGKVIPFSAPPSEVEDGDRPPEQLLAELSALVQMLIERVRVIHRQAHHREGDE